MAGFGCEDICSQISSDAVRMERTMIPKQLQNPEFRFYLIRENSKLPMECKWNSTNNYPFFHSKLLQHLRKGGNYGVCTGFGNLIVADYDDALYYETVRAKQVLPETFEVLSAGKHLPHQYFILTEPIFNKGFVDDKLKRRLCDIQGMGFGVTGPGSCIDHKYYQVRRDNPIAAINLSQLKAAFGYVIKNKSTATKAYADLADAELEKIAKELIRIGIQRTNTLTFGCPFHEMKGKGNLTLMPSGNLYCFHEMKFWTLDSFKEAMKHRD
jgi:hypothetical protein